MRVIKLPRLVSSRSIEMNLLELQKSIQVELRRIQVSNVSIETKEYALYNLERITLFLESVLEDAAA